MNSLARRIALYKNNTNKSYKEISEKFQISIYLTIKYYLIGTHGKNTHSESEGDIPDLEYVPLKDTNGVHY